MIEHEFHLVMPVALRGVRVQVQAHGAESAGRVLHVGDGGALCAEPLLAALHLVLAVGQGERVRARERIAGKERVAVQRLPVLARGVDFEAAALVQVDVARREDVVELKPSAISRATKRLPERAIP